MHKKICIVYTHHKLGDLIWQLPYIKAISEHYNEKVDLIVRENEVVNVPAGRYNCSTISPKRKDNKKFKNKAELNVMFSNDQKKYPVKIRLKLKYGYLVLELDKIIS